MRSFYSFLFYYSTALSTLLVLELIFFVPKPENYLFLLLFLPIAFYFWLKMITMTVRRHPPGEAKSNGLVRLGGGMLVMIVITITSISIHSAIRNLSNLSSQQSPEESSPAQEVKGLKDEEEKLPNGTDATDKVLLELGELKTELASLRAELRDRDYIQKILNITTSPDNASPIKESLFVTIKDPELQTINVFETKSSTSRVIGKAVYGKTYPSLKKDGSYYYITLSENIDVKGWVLAQYVKEVIP